MATNDGFSPYPIGLTAAQSVAAILRAHNFDGEIAGLVAFTDSDTAPLVANTKTGDIWQYTTQGKLYRGWVDGTDLLWFEV